MNIMSGVFIGEYVGHTSTSVTTNHVTF